MKKLTRNLDTHEAQEFWQSVEDTAKNVDFVNITKEDLSALKLEWFKKGIIECSNCVYNNDLVEAAKIATELLAAADAGTTGPLKREEV